MNDKIIFFINANQKFLMGVERKKALTYLRKGLHLSCDIIEPFYNEWREKYLTSKRGF